MKNQKKFDLTEYCLIGTFLHSCDRNKFFLCECQKWGHFSKKRPFVIFVCSIETRQCFLMIFLIWNHVNKRVVDEFFEVSDLEKHYVCRHF